MSRLPSRFPVGTRFVIEGKPDKTGKLKVSSRYVILPNGTQFDLMAKEKRPRPAPRRARAERRAG
jgi:predicted component of type VI protein secretion system